MANVGVHSYISNKASSTLSEHRKTGTQVPPALSSSFHFNHLQSSSSLSSSFHFNHLQSSSSHERKPLATQPLSLIDKIIATWKAHPRAKIVVVSPCFLPQPSHVKMVFRFLPWNRHLNKYSRRDQVNKWFHKHKQ